MEIPKPVLFNQNSQCHPVLPTIPFKKTVRFNQVSRIILSNENIETETLSLLPYKPAILALPYSVLHNGYIDLTSPLIKQIQNAFYLTDKQNVFLPMTTDNFRSKIIPSLMLIRSISEIEVLFKKKKEKKIELNLRGQSIDFTADNLVELKKMGALRLQLK